MLIGLVLVAGLVLAEPTVIDGDTLRDGAERYRVENLDAPEVGRRAQCPAERLLGEQARAEVIRMVADARTVSAIPSGRRDRYGRVVARIEIDGRDLGRTLIARRLARPWTGRKANFCS